MKLIIQSLDSRETQQITTRNSCTLQSLKASIAKKFSLPSFSKARLHLSLDGTTEISPASPQALLTYLGIVSGEHIYYTLNPNGFSAKLDSEPQEKSLSERAIETKKICGFLQNVYNVEVGNKFVDDHMLLIIAIHAVFLESGFVRVDRDSLHHPGMVSFRYTLPDLLGNVVMETVDLKFETFGSMMFVNGNLIRSDVDMLKLCLEYIGCLLPSIKIVCMSNGDSKTKLLHEKQVYDFWRIVKDGLALPLLINICGKTGLELPPCFAILPDDLKLKIMELLSGTDIAKVGCVSSELKCLSLNDNLWKKKYAEEFSVLDSAEAGNWKQEYVMGREKNRPVGKLHPIFILYENMMKNDSVKKCDEEFPMLDLPEPGR